MSNATRTITRGPVTITVSASAELVSNTRDLDGHKHQAAPSLIERQSIVISKDGKEIGRGEKVCDLDSSVKAHQAMLAKGAAAEVGGMPISAEAADQIRVALAEAVAEVTTPEIAEHKATRDAARDADMAADEAAAQRRARIYNA